MDEQPISKGVSALVDALSEAGDKCSDFYIRVLLEDASQRIILPQDAIAACNQGVAGSVLDIMIRFPDDMIIQMSGCTIIKTLVRERENRDIVLSAGVVPVLCTLLSQHSFAKLVCECIFNICVDGGKGIEEFMKVDIPDYIVGLLNESIQATLCVVLCEVISVIVYMAPLNQTAFLEAGVVPRLKFLLLRFSDDQFLLPAVFAVICDLRYLHSQVEDSMQGSGLDASLIDCIKLHEKYDKVMFQGCFTILTCKIYLHEEFDLGGFYRSIKRSLECCLFDKDRLKSVLELKKIIKSLRKSQRSEPVVPRKQCEPDKVNERTSEIEEKRRQKEIKDRSMVQIREQRMQEKEKERADKLRIREEKAKRRHEEELARIKKREDKQRLKNENAKLPLEEMKLGKKQIVESESRKRSRSSAYSMHPLLNRYRRKLERENTNENTTRTYVSAINKVIKLLDLNTEAEFIKYADKEEYANLCEHSEHAALLTKSQFRCAWQRFVLYLTEKDEESVLKYADVRKKLLEERYVELRDIKAGIDPSSKISKNPNTRKKNKLNRAANHAPLHHSTPPLVHPSPPPVELTPNYAQQPPVESQMAALHAQYIFQQQQIAQAPFLANLHPGIRMPGANPISAEQLLHMGQFLASKPGL